MPIASVLVHMYWISQSRECSCLERTECRQGLLSNQFYIVHHRI